MVSSQVSLSRLPAAWPCFAGNRIDRRVIPDMVFWRRSCPSSKLNPRELVGGFERLAVGCFDGDADKRALPPARSDPRTRTALLLESVALRHQIAVLERSGTRRPCFRFWDR
jgi:hypothetical protein